MWNNFPPTRSVIGASLSEPHIDEFALYIYMYIYLVRRAVSHFRVLFCAFLRHSLIQKLLTNYSYSTQREDTNRLATARTETTRRPTYSMARTIGATAWHLSMPLFVLPLTVELGLSLHGPTSMIQWPHR